MGIRQTLNEKPAIGIGFGIAFVVLAVILTVWYVHGPSAMAPPDRKIDISKAFYSSDDGKTTFLDSFAKVTPFQHNGKDAVRAYLYRCGDKEFVGFLGRNTELGRAENADRVGIDKIGTAIASPPIFEVKKPGTGNKWIPLENKNIPAWQNVTNVTCPDGSGIPMQLEPGQQ